MVHPSSCALVLLERSPDWRWMIGFCALGGGGGRGLNYVHSGIADCSPSRMSLKLGGGSSHPDPHASEVVERLLLKVMHSRTQCPLFVLSQLDKTSFSRA